MILTYVNIYKSRQKSRIGLHWGIQWLRIIEKSVNVVFQPRRESNDDNYGMSFRDSIAPNQCRPQSTPLTIVNTALLYTIQDYNISIIRDLYVHSIQ